MKNLNKLYELYTDNNNYKILNQIYKESLSLGMKLYYKYGIDQYRFIDQDEMHSIVGFSLTKALERYKSNSDTKFSTYLSAIIKNNIYDEIKRNKFLRIYFQINVDQTIYQDKDGKEFKMEDMLGDIDYYLNDELLSELMEEVASNSIHRYNPEVESKKKAHDVLIKVMNELLNDKTYDQIAKDLGYNSTSDIYQFVKKIRRGANKMVEFKDCKPTKRVNKNEDGIEQNK